MRHTQEQILQAGSQDGAGGIAWLGWRGPVPAAWRRRAAMRAFVWAARAVGLRIWICEFRRGGVVAPKSVGGVK